MADQIELLREFLSEKGADATDEDWQRMLAHATGVRDQLRAIEYSLRHAGVHLRAGSDGQFDIVYDDYSPAQLRQAIERGDMELRDDQHGLRIVPSNQAIDLQVRSVRRTHEGWFDVTAGEGGNEVHITTQNPPSAAYGVARVTWDAE